MGYVQQGYVQSGYVESSIYAVELVLLNSIITMDLELESTVTNYVVSDGFVGSSLSRLSALDLEVK